MHISKYYMQSKIFHQDNLIIWRILLRPLKGFMQQIFLIW